MALVQTTPNPSSLGFAAWLAKNLGGENNTYDFCKLHIFLYLLFRFYMYGHMGVLAIVVP